MSAKQHQLFAVTYWLLQAATLFMFLIVGAIVLGLVAFLGASAFGVLTAPEVAEVVRDLGMPESQIVLVGTFALLASLVCVMLLTFAVMLTTRIVESAMEGNPFVAKNADRLMQIGWLLLAMEVAGWLIGPAIIAMVPQKLADGITFEASVVGPIGILLVFVLAQIFRHGTQLRDDLEGTV